MFSINVPRFSADHCLNVDVSVVMTLGATQLQDLRASVGDWTDKTVLRASFTAIGEKVGERQGGLTANISVQPVAEELSGLESDGLATEEESGPTDACAAYLNLDFSAFVLAGETLPEESVNVERFNKALDWLRASENIEADIRGVRSFDPASYESVVAFPDAPRPFSTVDGLALSKRAEAGDDKRVLYQVTVYKSPSKLGAGVVFYSRIELSADVMQRLLERTSEIAGFAVRRSDEATV